MTTVRCHAVLIDKGKKYGCIREAGHPLTARREIETDQPNTNFAVIAEDFELHQGMTLDGQSRAQWADGVTGAISHHDAIHPSRADREGESQPLPSGTDDQESSHEVAMRLLAKRLEVGIRRYGQGLQPNNGRDSLLDAIEESCDLLVYMITEWRERHPGEEFPLR
jgi:hypothetical protein